MKTWIEGLLLMAAVPLVWKLMPGLWDKVKLPVNNFIKMALLKTKSLWKGHAAELETGIDEADKELKEDIEDVDKQP